MELLEQHFHAAFAAPDGIKKMRELILMLATQGKLVPQDPNDPPASQLLQEIEAEKKRLVKEGKIKAPKPLPPIMPEERPYALPQGWKWVRLGEIGVWRSGSTPNRANGKYYGGNIPWVKSGEIKQGRIQQTEESITKLALKECSLSLNPKGSVLVAMYGANIGEVGILDIEATTNQAICACKTFTAFDERYLLSLITSLKQYFISQGAGAAQPNISREKIVATPFPLPPLPEQRRIVAKIDQLMARCDEVETLHTEREQKRRSVHTAALKQLLDAQTSDSFASAWQFITQNFAELYEVKENVTELRKAILQLAFMGKLVRQNANDPPASQLLTDIEAEKKRLVKEGKIKTPKLLPEIKAEEVPYLLPLGWKWVRIRSICHDWGQKIPNGRFTYIDVGSINNKIGVIGHEVQILEAHEAPSRARKLVREGTVIYSTIRPYLLNIAIIEDEYEYEPIASTAFAILHPVAGTNNRFIYSYLRSPVFIKYVESKMKGVAYPAINDDDFFLGILPLPPLPEQHRIVAKIDQLMARCDELEKQIDAAADKQIELLNAVAAQV